MSGAAETDLCVSNAYAAIQTHRENGASVPLACRGISVAVDGNYTLTLLDGTTTIVVFLAAGTIHPISTRTALSSGAGTAIYWY